MSQYVTTFNARCHENLATAGDVILVESRPKIVLTDDASAERNALKCTWPGIILLLCLFHILQAVWGWLWKASHHVEKVHRPILFNLFKNLVYSKTEDEYSEALEVFDNSEVIEKYTNFSTHVENNLLPRKYEWAISDRIANKLETHGTNTTMLSRVFD